MIIGNYIYFQLPTRVHEAMQMQVEAERRKRATILESEGVREADINVAEGKRQSRILASEAQRMEQINHANGEAAAMLAVAEARAQGLNIVSKSLMLQEGKNAASLFIAEEYVHAFNKLARTNNTLILPSNVGDVTSLVGQAMSIYGAVSKHNQQHYDASTTAATTEQLVAQNNPKHLSDLIKDSQRPATPTTMVTLEEQTDEHESNRRKDATLLNSEQMNIDFNKNNK